MANKIIETNLPAVVITEIDRHLTKEETKHPFFAESILPAIFGNTEFIKKWFKKSREDREKTKSVYDVLMQENYEIFEAIQDNNIKNARYKIYDTIAVLLRLDKVLQEKQRYEDFKQNDIPLLNRNLESRNEIRSTGYWADSHHPTAVL